MTRAKRPCFAAIIATIAAFGAIGEAWTQEGKAGGIAIVAPYVRATPPAARVGGGYLMIRNGGTTPDRLMSIKSPAARSVEIHSSTTEGGVARMRHLPDGLAVPAGTDTILAPGGLHLMFIEPTAPLVAGQQVAATLVFERAGPVEVVFEVRPLGR